MIVWSRGETPLWMAVVDVSDVCNVQNRDDPHTRVHLNNVKNHEFFFYNECTVRKHESLIWSRTFFTIQQVRYNSSKIRISWQPNNYKKSLAARKIRREGMRERKAPGDYHWARAACAEREGRRNDAGTRELEWWIARRGNESEPSDRRCTYQQCGPGFLGAHQGWRQTPFPAVALNTPSKQSHTYFIFMSLPTCRIPFSRKSPVKISVIFNTFSIANGINFSNSVVIRYFSGCILIVHDFVFICLHYKI